MTLHLYETARALEKEIRESTEFIQLKYKYANVFAEPEAKAMFVQFHKLQMELEQKTMNGLPVSPEDMERVRQMAMTIRQNEKIASFLEAEYKMGQVITEINKIIMKPLEELYGRQ